MDVHVIPFPPCNSTVIEKDFANCMLQDEAKLVEFLYLNDVKGLRELKISLF